MNPFEIAFAICLAGAFALIGRMMLTNLELRRSIRHQRRELHRVKDKLAAFDGAPTKSDMESMRKMLLDREGAEKLVGRVNDISRDMMALKSEVATISRAANAISLKRIASGVVPPPKTDDAQ